jgi:lysophospholipase L1-like esterase
MYHPIASAPGFITPGRVLPAGSGGPMFDWLHPNVAGYVLLGDAWYETLATSLR